MLPVKILATVMDHHDEAMDYWNQVTAELWKKENSIRTDSPGSLRLCGTFEQMEVALREESFDIILVSINSRHKIPAPVSELLKESKSHKVAIVSPGIDAMEVMFVFKLDDNPFDEMYPIYKKGQQHYNLKHLIKKLKSRNFSAN